jgi:hypothetical protein
MTYELSPVFGFLTILIVDKFWHAHMLSPKLYEKHCKILIGEIIDHEAMYTSPKKIGGSDYRYKKAFLFQFEEKAFAKSHNDKFGGMIVLSKMFRRP